MSSTISKRILRSKHLETVIGAVQLPSLIRLFATPWTAAHQAFLFFTISWSLFKLMYKLCHPLLLLPSIFPSIRVFCNESVLHIRWPKYWSFNISPSVNIQDWFPLGRTLEWTGCRWHHPYGRKWRGTKKPLDESESGEWKVGLKLNIQKMKIMASGPITSWEIDGETVETVTDYILEGSKITADGDCSHEIKRCLLLGRKVITNPDSVLKSRDITLPTKVRLVKAFHIEEKSRNNVCSYVDLMLIHSRKP